MASARELLEQADALMRKNRDRVATDIPVLVDAVKPPEGAGRATQATAAAAPAAIDIPVLTDIVEAPVVSLIAANDKAPLVSPSFEGDPSNWLVMDTIDPSMHSVIGGSPDAVSAPPAFTSKAAGSAPTPPPARSAPRLVAEKAADEDLPFVWDDPPPRSRVLADVPQADEGVTSLRTPRVEASGAHASEAHVVAVEATPRDGVPAWTEDDGSTADDEPLAPATAAKNIDDAEAVADVRPEDVAAKASTEPGLSAAEQVAPAPNVVPFDSATSLTEAVARSAGQPPIASDRVEAIAEARTADAGGNNDAHWQALAEQISMQVLQRVDLFTDAGLRDQLAARLEPIVARASAALVDSITEHVGQLLRTYVAEAIEREIAAWRRDQP